MHTREPIAELSWIQCCSSGRGKCTALTWKTARIGLRINHCGSFLSQKFSREQVLGGRGQWILPPRRQKTHDTESACIPRARPQGAKREHWGDGSPALGVSAKTNYTLATRRGPKRLRISTFHKILVVQTLLTGMKQFQSSSIEKCSSWLPPYKINSQPSNVAELPLAKKPSSFRKSIASNLPRTNQMFMINHRCCDLYLDITWNPTSRSNPLLQQEHIHHLISSKLQMPLQALVYRSVITKRTIRYLTPTSKHQQSYLITPP